MYYLNVTEGAERSNIIYLYIYCDFTNSLRTVCQRQEASY